MKTEAHAPKAQSTFDGLPRLDVIILRTSSLEEQEAAAREQIEAFAAAVGQGQPFTVWYAGDDDKEREHFDVLVLDEAGAIDNAKTQLERDLEGDGD